MSGKGTRSQIEAIAQKLVGMSNFDAEGFDSRLREVPQVRGHDGVAASGDGRREDMLVAQVGKIKRRDESLVSRNQTIPSRQIHEIARALQGGTVPVRFVAQQRLDPLPMDVRRPFRLDDVARRQLQEDVAYGRGIQDVGVEKNQCHGRS